MITLPEAVPIARTATPPEMWIRPEDAVELEQGWYFPFRAPVRADGRPLMAGSRGVIVNRLTGACFMLGSAFRAERDLVLYDQGFQFPGYDLTITRVLDEPRTIDTLRRIGITIVIPEFEHGVEWRIPRPLTRAELRTRLASLPCTFVDVALYYRVEDLLAAKANGWFEYDVREHRATGEGGAGRS